MIVLYRTVTAISASLAALTLAGCGSTESSATSPVTPTAGSASSVPLASVSPESPSDSVNTEDQADLKLPDGVLVTSCETMGADARNPSKETAFVFGSNDTGSSYVGRVVIEFVQGGKVVDKVKVPAMWVRNSSQNIASGDGTTDPEGAMRTCRVSSASAKRVK